eukprot:170992-Prymnesium_polylepis.2
MPPQHGFGRHRLPCGRRLEQRRDEREDDRRDTAVDERAALHAVAELGAVLRTRVGVEVAIHVKNEAHKRHSPLSVLPTLASIELIVLSSAKRSSMLKLPGGRAGGGAPSGDGGARGDGA